MNRQAGEDLFDHDIYAQLCAFPLKPFGLNLGQLTKKRGIDISKESAVLVH